MEQGGEFTIFWKINNFGYLKKDITSPPVVADTMDKSDWVIRLRPAGSNCNEYITGLIGRLSKGPEHISVNYQFSTLAPNGRIVNSFLMENNVFKRNQFRAIERLVRKEEMYNDDYFTFPQKTLIVACKIITTDEEPSESGICFIRSSIDIEHRVFTWNIEEFSSLRLNQRRDIFLERTSDALPSFSFTLYLSRDNKIHIKVSETERVNQCVTLTCQLTVIEKSGREADAIEDEHTFGEMTGEQVWYLDPFLTKSSLLARKTNVLPNDVLTFRCKCSISSGKESHQIQCVKYGPSASIHSNLVLNNGYNSIDYHQTGISSTMVKDLQAMFEDLRFSDATLRADNMDFPVHKAILCARSQVFNSMFDCDMKEKTTGVVDLSDLTADTVRRMLTYIYTDRLEELQMDWANESLLRCG